MLCIQVPISEMSCPLKKSWKLRWRKARKVAGRVIARVGEPFSACSSEPGGLFKGKSFKYLLHDSAGILPAVTRASCLRRRSGLHPGQHGTAVATFVAQSTRMPKLRVSIQSGTRGSQPRFPPIWDFPDAARSGKVGAAATGLLVLVSV